MKKLLTICMLLLSVAALQSCGEYQRVLKSNDPNVKYEYAKKVYDKGEYARAASVLQEIVGIFKGTTKAEETLFMLGMCSFHTKDYLNAGSYLHAYYTRYPRGINVEDARYYCGYSYYLDSPDVQLDQTPTRQGIEEFSAFIDFFPNSPRANEVKSLTFDLQDKLALKELQNASLYYNLGTYGGNNYQSAVITANNALKQYPYTKHKEELELIVLKAKYQEAEQSVDEKKHERFENVIDEYFSFINNYPESKHRREVDSIYKLAQKYAKR